MLVRVVLVDVNPKMVAAWRSTFEENGEVEILQGSMLDQTVSAYVTPTNSRGSMDGGLDAVLKRHFGEPLQTRVQKEIARLYDGIMPVGTATCVSSGRDMPGWVISTPTMVESSEDISDTLNVALACAAAFQAVHIHNFTKPGSIQSVALPGLGANTGKVPVEIYDLMWTGYNLFREREFRDYPSMRTALEEILGDLGPTSVKKKAAAAPPAGPAGGGKTGQPTPSEKDEDVDFDDDD